MPKFEFNPRTGMMEPKKDDQIYFAQSQGGGLRIDDHKNNVKYVIERDGRITNLFALDRNKSVNLYDMRDARIIADRVVRMFGKDHKYANFEYFLKGHRISESIVKDFQNFVGEGVWTQGIRRSSENDVIRKEDAVVICKLPDETPLIAPLDCQEYGSVIDFGDDKYYHIEETDTYIVGFYNVNEEVYFKYDPESDEVVNLVEFMTAPKELRENDFAELRAIINARNLGDDDLDELEVEEMGEYMRFTFGGGRGMEFMVFDDEYKATEYAEEYEREVLDECYDFSDSKTMKPIIDAWRNSYGDRFIDVKSIEDSMRESYESWFDDMDEDDLIDDLIRYGIIDDSEKYFETDDDGELNHELPKFEISDYKDDYVDHMMDDIDDVVDEYLLNYGYEGFEEYIDKDKLAEHIVDENGRGCIAGYDNREDEEMVNDIWYLIYRTN